MNKLGSSNPKQQSLDLFKNDPRQAIQTRIQQQEVDQLVEYLKFASNQSNPENPNCKIRGIFLNKYPQNCGLQQKQYLKTAIESNHQQISISALLYNERYKNPLMKFDDITASDNIQRQNYYPHYINGVKELIDREKSLKSAQRSMQQKFYQLLQEDIPKHNNEEKSLEEIIKKCQQGVKFVESKQLSCINILQKAAENGMLPSQFNPSNNFKLENSSRKLISLVENKDDSQRLQEPQLETSQQFINNNEPIPQKITNIQQLLEIINSQNQRNQNFQKRKQQQDEKNSEQIQEQVIQIFKQYSNAGREYISQLEARQGNLKSSLDFLQRVQLIGQDDRENVAGRKISNNNYDDNDDNDDDIFT